MFANCFVSTINTTTQLAADGTTHIFTGDIPALWLRDSAAQVNHYIPLANSDIILQHIIEGLIQRQAKFVIKDPYANAFRFQTLGSGQLSNRDKADGKTEEIWERKYEIDSLAYFLSLSHKYWQAVGTETCRGSEVYNLLWKSAAAVVVDTWIREQNRNHETSPYKYHSEMPNGGHGAPVKHTGMTWSGFRPSDDACTYGYLVPSNMFAVVVLKQLGELLDLFYPEDPLAEKARELADVIDKGIHAHAVVHKEGYGKVYAYETDGLGNYNFMDDANVPSLLSIPYLQYTSPNDPTGEIYKNTRKFILSKENPYYFDGTRAKGIGSPHTFREYIWHISLTMQALTSNDEAEILELIDMCENTDAGKEVMHESFHKSDPNRFSRPWFAWANSLFGEMIVKYHHLLQ
eukprot:TRINITY_DN6174_c0_g3_i1.p1 TRINITY_DN6174_c0_g3~~TRINITY_DN6174_c0_g3_i1.p1  ORF type:complete len:468 (+),score=103.21 TRINITY_DN6174_c0_g3_i1:195-1406(+)